MILQDLGIEVSGVAAAKIRKEAFEDIDLSNSRKEATIREKVLETVEVEAPKVLGYIQDEISSLRTMAYGNPEKKIPAEDMSVTERTRCERCHPGGLQDPHRDHRPAQARPAHHNYPGDP